MSTRLKRLITPEEYLAIERDLSAKHEYHYGEMFATGGASTKHNQITFNLAGILHAQLKDLPCVAFANDMRVKISTTGSYVYPDVMATCQPPQFEDKHLDTLLNPQAAIEVLSDSTEAFDRGEKFEMYSGVDSLREYLLVAQKYPHISHFQRDADADWTLRMVHGLDQAVEVASIGCTLRLADVYAKVEFPPIEETDRAAGIHGLGSPR